MIKLNESAAAIGALIDGQRSVAAIVAELDAQFPGVPELGEDVEQFMLVALDKHWIELALMNEVIDSAAAVAADTPGQPAASPAPAAPVGLPLWLLAGK